MYNIFFFNIACKTQLSAHIHPQPHTCTQSMNKQCYEYVRAWLSFMMPVKIHYARIITR